PLVSSIALAMGSGAARATLASACVSLASLVGCALMAIGARADALAWLSDAAIGAMLGDDLE
ncbi:hypothetical protein, partial [Serratia marcescens]|uniref:hypothetical protein n=1 Tax=Serratia marcescens TaxID=615 RepID=UPI0013DBAAC3